MSHDEFMKGWRIAGSWWDFDRQDVILVLERVGDAPEGAPHRYLTVGDGQAFGTSAVLMGLHGPARADEAMAYTMARPNPDWWTCNGPRFCAKCAARGNVAQAVGEWYGDPVCGDCFSCAEEKAEADRETTRAREAGRPAQFGGDGFEPYEAEMDDARNSRIDPDDDLTDFAPGPWREDFHADS